MAFDLRERWTRDEIRKLKEHYNKVSVAEIKELFPNRDYFSIKSKAKRLGVAKKYNVLNEYEINRAETVIHILCKGILYKCFMDTCNLDKVRNIKWHLSKAGYVVSRDGIKMHRLITDAPNILQVDHINHNRLDNRINNLRLCTSTENGQNKSPVTNSNTGLRGISFKTREQKYRAQLQADGKIVFHDYFDTIEKARNAVETARKKYLPFSSEEVCSFV